MLGRGSHLSGLPVYKSSRRHNSYRWRGDIIIFFFFIFHSHKIGILSLQNKKACARKLVNSQYYPCSVLRVIVFYVLCVRNGIPKNNEFVRHKWRFSSKRRARFFRVSVLNTVLLVMFPRTGSVAMFSVQLSR